MLGRKVRQRPSPGYGQVGQCKGRRPGHLRSTSEVSIEFVFDIEGHTRKVVVSGIILVQHGSRNVRNATTSITFPSHVDLEVLDPEACLEVLEELDEVLGNLFFRRGRNVPDRKAGTDRLLNPRSQVRDLES